MNVLIFSTKRNMWWGAGGAGYTPDVDLAGRYSPAAAGDLCTTNHIAKEFNIIVPESSGPGWIENFNRFWARKERRA